MEFEQVSHGGFGQSDGLSHPESSSADSDPACLHIVQITDTHLFADPCRQLLGVVTEQTFQLVLQSAMALQPLPDLLLLTGDLSQDGSPASYQRLRHHLRSLPVDAYWLPGNHDHLSTMEIELRGQYLHVEKQIARLGWACILVNSRVPGQDGGYLTDETLAQLRSDLEWAQRQGLYGLVSLHHPPFQVNSHWLDGSTLHQPERLFQVLDDFDNVRLVLFGHIHQDFQCTRRAVEYLACPSTCIQFRPGSQDFDLEVIPPAFRQLWLYREGHFSTRLVRVPAALQQPNLAIKGY